MDRVADAPVSGDVARMRGGIVDYSVSLVGGGEVFATRVQIVRGSEPEVADCRMSVRAWGDLVRHGASTVVVVAP